MARSRNIKPGFFRNEDLVALPYETRLLFVGLWILADREGRLEDRPQRIKMEIFPADNTDVRKGLDALVQSKFLTRYEVDGLKYLSIDNFLKHQHPHRKEVPSTIPAPVFSAVDETKAPGFDAMDECETPVIGAMDEAQDRSQDIADPAFSGPSPADSLNLIPDSLNLIPDSLQKKKTRTKKVNGQHPPDAEVEINPQVWADFKALRARKRAPLTRTAIDGIKRECKKAGITFEAALEIACERGWAGFKAEWIADEKRGLPIDYDALAREIEKETADAGH